MFSASIYEMPKVNMRKVTADSTGSACSSTKFRANPKTAKTKPNQRKIIGTKPPADMSLDGIEHTRTSRIGSIGVGTQHHAISVISVGLI